MKKQCNKMISLLLAMCMLFSLSTVAFASNTSNGELGQEPEIIETSTYRMATTKDDQYSYTSIYTFATGTIAFVQTELATGKVILSVDSADAKHISTRAVTDEDTFLGYRYINHGSGVWELRMPQDQFTRSVPTYYIKINQNASTKPYIDAFTQAVDALDDAEKDVLLAAGLSIVTESAKIIGLLMVAGPVFGVAKAAASIVASLGLGATMYMKYEAYLTAANRCYNAWFNAYDYCPWYG